MKVFVTYDPLFEKPICVHEKEDMTCLLCDAIRKERSEKESSKRYYQLSSTEFEVQKEKVEGTFIVRLYDMFDGWIDVSSGNLTKDEAKEFWNEKTDNGSHHIDYDEGQYYCIFPSDTKMRETPEKRGR